MVLGLGHSLALCSCTYGPAADQGGLSWLEPPAEQQVYGIVRLVISHGHDSTGTWEIYLDEISPDARLLEGQFSPNVEIRALWTTTGTTNGAHELIARASSPPDLISEASLQIHVNNGGRWESIPADARKMTPANDDHPPRLMPPFDSIWEDPIPLPGPVNTAGGEDSPFITPDGHDLYFWFTPDVNAPLTDQVQDRVTGIYHSRSNPDGWDEPERVYLSLYDHPTLDGAPTIAGDQLWFASARAGNYRGVDIWISEWDGQAWMDWRNAGARLNQEFQLGEMHISQDGRQLYYDSSIEGGKGMKDIWQLRRVGGEWSPPESVTSVNSAHNDGWPFLTQDGRELWFTRTDPGAPEILRSQLVDGLWQEPEVILTSFAGEPSLDAAGNIYFVHHYLDDTSATIVEADIYVCFRRAE